MSEQRLQMDYHPAKKEVRFRRFASGQEVKIRDDSKLRKYMNDRGKFILQDHGKKFFDDIAAAFDGEREVLIEVKTTRVDYEDLEQMIEHYNNENKEDGAIKITATQIAELPDMDETYRMVKEHGERSIAILKEHREAICTIPHDKVKECVEDFTKAIDEKIKDIRDKIDKMTDDHINLCFAGVYSAGKSALINTILGYQILPENIKSSTAKTFRIESPKSGETVRIRFNIKDGAEKHSAILSWHETSGRFFFSAGPYENDAKKEIQETIEASSSLEQHRQVYEILKELNSRDDVNAKIDIYFPIPLDCERVKFVIYDTPGTDSNFVEHQTVLENALSEQTHSILVFVATPNKMEGEGNNALLSRLKTVEEKEKTSIDLDRSLFVINWADSIKVDDRVNLQKGKIQHKSDKDFSINLSDKKLFFTSARLAYAARAQDNGVQISEEDEDFFKEKSNLVGKEYAQYFRQNRCAASEYATRKMLETSAAALEEAKQAGKTPFAAFICSGVYALEEEIKTYGKKYAAAVRAFPIIDSVDEALKKVKAEAGALQATNKGALDEINEEIENLRNDIGTSIEAAYKECMLPGKLPKDILETLKLSEDCLHEKIINPVVSFIGELLQERWLGLRNPEFKEKDKETIVNKIDVILNQYTHEFRRNRQVLLEKERDTFIEEVKSAIRENGDISDEAKAFVLAIREPEIKPFSDPIETFGKMYQDSKSTTTFLWFELKGIDKAKFIKDAEEELLKIARKMADGFEEDFKATLDAVLDATKSEFKQNIERYSTLMQAKLADKEAMDQLGKKIAAAAEELEARQGELEKMIWEGKKNEE